MGRIKTTLIKRTTRELISESPETFSKTFEENKKALGNTLPSKRLRNMIAGYLTRIKRNTHTIIEDKEEKTE